MSQSSFPFDYSLSAAALAAQLALPVPAGHFDELRGGVAEQVNRAQLAEHWQQFFQWLGVAGFADLDRRLEIVMRQIRENGITYNVYADPEGATRPWSLNLLPMIIPAHEWNKLESSIAQRACVLNDIMADVYGEQRLLHQGFLPAALVYGHPGYLRSLTGFNPPGKVFLHIAAFDLARAPDGRWWVVSQRTQAPSGLGYVLENRLTISRVFPEAFREMHIQHLASGYRVLLETIDRLSQGASKMSAHPRIVLLTPGPYNETYFEHAYLARYLGITLVEGGDLTVRGDQLFLKTMYGLERVHAILRRLDDDFCDPLELRPDSSLGIPGLLHAIRAGNVLVANALGSGFLESPGINGFLPAICQHLRNEELALPSLPSWWCGEQAARDAVLAQLSHYVVKSTYPTGSTHPPLETFVGSQATPEELQLWSARIAANPNAYTAQSYLPWSQAPTWSGACIVPRATMLRVFAIADSQGSWRVLPGGLTRIAQDQQQSVSMQRGGSSQDTWVMTPNAVDVFTLLPTKVSPEELVSKRWPVSSRAAENLFWMGRYAERTDNTLRLVRLSLSWLHGDANSSRDFLEVMANLCHSAGLVPHKTSLPWEDLAAFERGLIEALPRQRTAIDGTRSIGFNLETLVHAASQIRDRLSSEHWRLIRAASGDFAQHIESLLAKPDYALAEILQVLEALAIHMAAITGAQTDRMTRDDGWRLLTIGRQLERLSAMSIFLSQAFEMRTIHQESGFNFLLDLFDSSITYRAHYQRRFEILPLLDLLVFDPANPRSLMGCITTLHTELARLPSYNGASLLENRLPKLYNISLTALCDPDGFGRYTMLDQLATDCMQCTHQLSNEIGQRYFNHASDLDQAVS